MRRLPTFHVGTPSRSEVDGALRTTGALIATYLTEPDRYHAANGWLYLCSNRDFSLRTLAPVMQRNVRRALRELTIAPLGAADVLTHGSLAYCDTRRRNGLDDGTPMRFRRNFACRGRIDRPGRTYIGAWRNGQLAAFVAVLHVDDWAEVGCFSMDSMLRHRPNDALLYAALSHYLAAPNCRIVSFGLSSIQAHSKAAGLHRFKRKVGFDASPVHRAFVLHPSVRPFANRLTVAAAQRTVNGLLRLRPRSRRLKKLGGMLGCMLGAPSTIQTAAPSNDGARRGAAAARRGPLCTM